MKNIRLDQHLLQLGLVPDLASAQRYVLAGACSVNGQRVDKPGTRIPVQAKVELRQRARFVGRGACKLEHAVEAFQLQEAFRGKRVLDCGASTGGFTDLVLELGATSVTTVDVGTNQLAWKLRNDPRVDCHERTDVRSLPTSDHDWVLADVSFNSVARLAESLIAQCHKDRGQLLVLVKPQFELPRQRIPEGGIVTDNEDQQAATQIVLAAFAAEGFHPGKAAPCPVQGRKGNREFFLHLRR